MVATVADTAARPCDDAGVGAASCSSSSLRPTCCEEPGELAGEEVGEPLDPEVTRVDHVVELDALTQRFEISRDDAVDELDPVERRGSISANWVSAAASSGASFGSASDSAECGMTYT